MCKFTSIIGIILCLCGSAVDDTQKCDDENLYIIY